MKTPIFTGAATAIVTPFRGYEIDYKKVEEIIERQYAGGVSAIVVNGTTGESPTQPIEEHEIMVDFCVKKVAGRMKVVAGVGSNDTMTSLKLAKSAKAAGVDGIMMLTPYYNKASQHGIVKHFTTVADAVDVPMIVYNVPGRTGIGITVDTYKTLSKHPNINGTKEASGDFSLISHTRAICGDDLNVWSGNDDNTIPMMSLGACGVISVAANIIPNVMADICEYCLNGDFKAATALYSKYADFIATLFIEVNPIPVKTAMNLMGMDVGDLRLPLCEMAPNTLEKLKQSMLALGLL